MLIITNYILVQEVKDPGTSLVSETVDVLDESVEVLGAVSEVETLLWRTC